MHAYKCCRANASVPAHWPAFGNITMFARILYWVIRLPVTLEKCPILIGLFSKRDLVMCCAPQSQYHCVRPHTGWRPHGTDPWDGRGSARAHMRQQGYCTVQVHCSAFAYRSAVWGGSNSSPPQIPRSLLPKKPSLLQKRAPEDPED